MDPQSSVDDEFKAKLTPEQYAVLRERGTEPAFTGEHLSEKRKGHFKCMACGNQLFTSVHKFDSGTGWPSFDDAVPGSVAMVPDDTYGMKRTEVVCAKCKSHLGHVFNDGPATTGKRYCINSVCLGFDAAQ